jgi:glycosyltransferase involved in cell wall biosynthesis
MGADQPSVALVVATYNRARPMERLLECLERQTLARDRWQLVVAIDGSVDDTEAVLERAQKRGTLPLQFFKQANAGQSVARHNAILKATAEHVVVIDDDMEVCPAFLSEHLAASRKAPGKAIVIGKVVPEERFMRKPLFTAVQEHYLWLLHKRLERGETPNASAFVTQNVSFPRALYLGIGGFDASLRLDEDRELGARMERAGGVFVFAQLAWAIHHSDVGSYEKWARRHYEYGKYAVQVWEKLGKSPHMHPLRNFVDGSRINRALVKLVCPDPERSVLAEKALRRAGNALQALRIAEPAIYTHKGIQAVLYHRGVRDALGSWQAVEAMEREYLTTPNRPHAPTGRGATFDPTTERENGASRAL